MVQPFGLVEIPPSNVWELYIWFLFIPGILRAILLVRPFLSVTKQLAPHGGWIVKRLKELPVRGYTLLAVNEFLAFTLPILVVLIFRLMTDPLGWPTWGESNWIGTTAGAMIGGLLGTQICGEEEIVGTKCQDIAVVFGTIGGAAAGTVIQAKLGNHNGYQYIVNIDSCPNESAACITDEDKAFVQGDKVPLSNGQRVVIIYGDDVRIIPYEN